MEAEQALFQVYELLSKEINSDISLDKLLNQAEVTREAYLRGLSFCSIGNGVVLQRKPSDCWINSYNPDILRVWQANMDIQFILNPYACVMYIASYMLKSERSMGELLKQVSKESDAKDVRSQLRLLGSVFLNHREVSAQEAVYRILSLPLKQLSRKVGIFKKKEILEKLADDDNNIYQTSLIDCCKLLY